MVNRVLACGDSTGVAVGAGGVAGEGRAGGDLVHVAAVKDLDVEHGQQDFARP